MRVIRFFCGALILISCAKDKAEELVINPCADTVSFAQEIQNEIIMPNCAISGCHDNTASGGYKLDSYSDISQNAAIVFQTLDHQGGVTPMPFGGSKLSNSLIQKFQCWIDQGKLDN